MLKYGKNTTANQKGKTMTNILILHEGEQPTVLLVYSSLRAFSRIYRCMVEKRLNTKARKKDFDRSDIVMCVRGESPLTYAQLRCAKDTGKCIIYYLDDDLKDIPKSAFRYTKRKKWLIKCIRLADIFLTSNQLLADEYTEFLTSKRTVTMNTAVSEKDIPRFDCAKCNTIKLVYAASEAHASNFKTFINPILPSLFKEYKKRIELYFIGLHPKVDVGDYNSQVHYVQGMNLHDYNTYMQTHHFDIGLAPLVSTHFTERKYFNKYIEYARFGICGIYSRVMPYQLAIRDGWNGYFSDNTPDAWLKAIKKAIDSDNEREIIIKQARNHLLKEHSEKVIFEKLNNDIPELTEYKAIKTEKKYWRGLLYYKILHILFRVSESIYLFVRSLKLFGLEDTVEKIKRKMRKLL